MLRAVHLALICSALFLFDIYLAENENNNGVLDIAAFNVQKFGKKKLSDKAVKAKLIDIILRYDLILIQNIKDKSGKAIKKFVHDLNNVTNASAPKYKVEVSIKLGRNSSKELYGFIYRQDWLNVTSKFVYNDTNHVFEREPFIVRFASKKAAVKDFVVLGLHTKPDKAEKEISALTDVYESIAKKWGVGEVILMGDFNAGCSYIKNWKNIKLALDKKFVWLIDDGVDTTVKGAECPFDRIVIRGSKLLSAIVPESPGAYRFDYHMGINKSLAEKISDHYPVEFKIKSLEEYENIKYTYGFTFKDNSSTISKSDIYAMKARAESLKYKLEVLYKKSGEAENVGASAVAIGIPNALKELDKLYQEFPKLITVPQWNAARRQLIVIGNGILLRKGYGKFTTLYDYLKKKNRNIFVQLLCKIKGKLACYVKIGELHGASIVW